MNDLSQKQLKDVETNIRSELTAILEKVNEEIDRLNKEIVKLEEQMSGLIFGYGEHLVAIDALIDTLIKSSSQGIVSKFEEALTDGRERFMKILKNEEPPDESSSDDSNIDSSNENNVKESS